MKAQECRRGSRDSTQIPHASPEWTGCLGVNIDRQRENRHQHRRGEFHGLLGDRHESVLLAASAFVVVVVTGATRRHGCCRVMARRTRCMIGVMGRLVIVGGPVRVAVGHRLDRRRVLPGLARHAHAQPRVEVAAAERHRHRQEQGDEESKWTAAYEHTGESISLPPPPVVRGGGSILDFGFWNADCRSGRSTNRSRGPSGVGAC